MKTNPAETHNVAEKRPDVLRTMQRIHREATAPLAETAATAAE